MKTETPPPANYKQRKTHSLFGDPYLNSMQVNRKPLHRLQSVLNVQCTIQRGTRKKTRTESTVVECVTISHLHFDILWDSRISNSNSYL